MSNSIGSVGSKAKGLVPTGALASLRGQLPVGSSDAAAAPAAAAPSEAADTAQEQRMQPPNAPTEAVAPEAQSEQSPVNREEGQEVVIENSG
jgi:hypothetical protein